MKRISLLLMVIFGLSFTANAEKTFVRKNASSPGGQADLAAMNKAFEKMRALNCADGMSWYYQGAIHNIPGEINGTNKLCSSYQTTADTLFAWDNCTHVGGGSPFKENASWHFLLWHRLYIWHLEKIVRELSGKADFALPFWNYVSSNDLVMPAELRDQNGSLYTAARLSLLNNGQPIPPDMFQDLQEQMNEISDMTDFITYSKALEAAPHGFMHNLIGGAQSPYIETMFNEIYQVNDMSGLMANVPSAGFDPVFWLHHCEIDYIWTNWDDSFFGERPSLEELEKHPWMYNFINPDGSQVTYTIAEAYALGFNLDYTYESQMPALTAATANKTKSIAKPKQGVEPKIIAKQNVDEVIGETSFIKVVETKAVKDLNKSFTAESATRVYLDLNVVVYQRPTDYYKVYIRYEGDRDDYIGMMTFFEASHEHKGNHTIEESGMNFSFTFDITQEFKDSDEPFEIVIKKRGEGEVKVTLSNFVISTEG